MTKNDYRKGEQDALMGAAASSSAENYISGFFNGLKKTNPLFRDLDENSFREGYLGINYGESHNSSYLAGQMVKKMAAAARISELEKKVLTPTPILSPKDREKQDLDRLNEHCREKNLPPVSSWDDWNDRQARYMEEKYGYDTDK